VQCLAAHSFFLQFCVSAGVPADNKNWPPFFPIIHHDIANEIPIHAQRLQYLAFASWLGMRLWFSSQMKV